MRIVHFSDIHVGCLPATVRALTDKRILGSLNYLLRRKAQFHMERLRTAEDMIRRLAPDWIICTGDITCVGSPREFALARNHLELFRKAVGERFVYIPGNHDAYVRDSDCAAALERSFRELNSNRWNLRDLPVKHALGNLTLLLVNEAAPVACWRSSGHLSESARTWLHQALNAPRQEDEKRILVSHFPVRDAAGNRLPPRRRLDGDMLIDAALEAGQLDVALCGHIHQPFERRTASGAVEICAGSLPAVGRMAVLDYSYTSRTLNHFWVDVNDTDDSAVPLGAGLAAVVPTD